MISNMFYTWIRYHSKFPMKLCDSLWLTLGFLDLPRSTNFESRIHIGTGAGLKHHYIMPDDTRVNGSRMYQHIHDVHHVPKRHVISIECSYSIFITVCWNSTYNILYTWGCFSIEYLSETHLILKSRLPRIHFAVAKLFEILPRARQR